MMVYEAVQVGLMGSAVVLSKRGRDVCEAETRRSGRTSDATPREGV